MQNLLEGTDYEFVVPTEEGTTINIRLKTGDYKDTVFQYGKVGFDEQPDGAIYLRFVYNIIDTPLVKEQLEKDGEFKNYIGDLLVSIMSQNLDEGLVDEVGTDYSEESDSE